MAIKLAGVDVALMITKLPPQFPLTRAASSNGCAIKMRLPFFLTRGILVALVGVGLATAAFGRHKTPALPGGGAAAGDVSQQCYAEVGPVLQRAGGSLTPQVRNAYLDWAEKTVLQQLRAGRQTVPESCFAEARQDDTLRAALFGSVFPPDPSILQNYAQLRAALGEAFLAKYRSLVIAIAVARRIKGVEPDGNRDIGRDYQPGFWVDESLPLPQSEAEKDFIRRIANYMQQAHVSALDLFQNTGLQQQLRTTLFMQHVALNFSAEIKKSLTFGDRLKNAMVLLGQRPAAREPRPSTTAWLRHLVAINEATPASTPTVAGKVLPWPLFPLDKAPWPLLMPLAHSIPLSEAKYIWEAFQGRHGPDRYRTYGPYREGEDYMAHALYPSRWFWDAWPDRIVHGGQCCDLSKATVDLYSALGKPAMWAGQPGHANLISFQYDGRNWTVEDEQAFAGGPDVTTGQWYFDEDPGTQIRFRELYYWPFAEYHFGLVLAMNTGLKSYMDTRVAVHLFAAMPEADKPTLGVKLLRSTLPANPFNPAVWYRLAVQPHDANQVAALVAAAEARDPGHLAERPDNAKAAHKRRGNGAHSGGGEMGAQYWQTVAHWVALLSKAKLAGTHLGILKATYGDLPGGASADVTGKVLAMLKHNTLEVVANSDNFGDPANGAHKKLKVDFTVDGKADSLTVNEDETLKLEVAPVLAPTAQPGVAGSVKVVRPPSVQSREAVAAALLGNWKVEKTNGYRGTWTFTPDGKVTNADRHALSAAWTLESGAVMIRWDKKRWESLTLPIDPAGSTGPSWQGTVTAVKM